MKRILTFILGLALSAFAAATTLSPVQLLNPAGSTSGQAIVSSGPGSAPAWNTVAISSLTPVAGNTVLTNAAASSAAPTAFAMPGCSASSSALTWTASVGFTCNSSINATTLGGATFASPGAIGSTTPAAGTFTTVTASSGGSGVASSLTSSGSFSTLLITDVGASGAGIRLIGNGASTPSKYLLASGGQFQVINDAHSAIIFSLTDSGSLNAAGGINGTSVGAVTPSTGAFTALSATSTITPSQTAGIVGTTTNNNANAGSVGEYLTATTTNTSLTNGAGTNLTSESLTAGDWDVQCDAFFHPAAGTTITGLAASVSTTSASLGAFGSTTYIQTTFNTGSNNYIMSPDSRLSLASTTTVYCVGVAAFGTSTMQGDGFIRARRIR